MTGPDVPAGEIGPAFVPVRVAEVFTLEIDGEAVLLDERDQRLHLLNHSAALLWACFDGQASLADLARELSEELGHDLAQVLADTVDVARDLAAQGLLEGVAAAGAPVADDS